MPAPERRVGTVPQFAGAAPIQDILDPAADAGCRFGLRPPDGLQNPKHILGCDLRDVHIADDRDRVGRQRIAPLLPVLRILPGWLMGRDIAVDSFPECGAV